ncbi:MAG: hypothetical protein J6D11_02290 [Clostridia bacterium]|nr:hypothetical protein [Clostridia bacterium]
MEISRKKITTEEIHAKETELANSISSLTEGMKEDFAALGYVLETEITRENDNLLPEEIKILRATPITEATEYSDGYISSAKITVKREKTEEVLALEEEEAQEEEALEAMKLETEELPEDAQARKDEIALARSKRELERSVAFTTMFFVRVYKTFWRETVSINEGISEVTADLEEFLSVLKERAGEKADV